MSARISLHRKGQLRSLLRILVPAKHSKAQNDGKPVSTSKVARTRSAWPLLLVAVAMLFAVEGCGGGGSGGGSGTGGTDTDNGGGYGGGNDDDGNVDDGNSDAVQPTLASIQANVFTPICTQCHTGASAPQGLRLEAGMSYGMLVNVASAEVPSLMRVEPGNPDDSYLVHKIEGTATVGGRMPLGGPYLSADTIAAIRQWITDGALAAAQPASSKTTVTGAWPVADSTLVEAPDHIVLIADGELDTTRLHKDSVQVFNLNDIDPLTREPRQLVTARLQITSLAPTVIRLLVPDSDWTPGRYEVRIHGSGPMAVTDRSGRLIDGNVDGKPGGDFVMNFEIGSAK